MTREPVVYLFSWEDIPGNDNLRLLEYLKKSHGVDLVKIAKLDDSNIIKVTADKNYVLLSLNNEKTEVHILIDNVRTLETKKWTAKTENGKLNIYPLLHDYKSGTWVGKFMEGTWCGKGDWIYPGEWKGKGEWESGILKGDWEGKGTWNKDNGNDYEGDWKGKGTLSSRRQLGSKIEIFSLISIIGTVVSGIGTLIGLLGMKDIPLVFVGATTLVVVPIQYMQKIGITGKWDGTGKWTENQGVRVLTIEKDKGHWKIAGLEGELSGTIEECEKKH